MSASFPPPDAAAPAPAPAHDAAEREGALARLALRFTAFTEKWLPDAFGFVLVGTVIIFLLGLAWGESVFNASTTKPPAAPAGMGLVDAWGAGFWSLITFTMQMAMIVIGGYAVASSPPMARLIDKLAGIPRSPKAAVAFVAAVSMFASYLNWAFSLVFGAILAKEVARRNPDADYRALGAMAFLGLGTVWAQGFSGSAALQVASPASSPAAVQNEIKKFGYASGTIPLNDTILNWRAISATLVIFVVAVVMAWLIAPKAHTGKNAEELGITLRPLLGAGSEVAERQEASRPTRPGDRLEYSPVMTVLICLIGFIWVWRAFIGKDFFQTLDLNMINLILLLLAMALHWHPISMVKSVIEGTRAAAGVLLQFPFYGGIFGMIAYTGLSHKIADVLTSISNQFFYPPLIAFYSMILGVFVPSGGSKWVIEAPYVLDAAHQLGVSAGWMVVVYDLGEASANLLQPFWMLPTLAILGLKAKDIMGYTFTMFLACFPAALIAVTVLAPHIG
jgi:short-chain fatty acids transporter